jgi:hypothetical protein
LGICQKNAFLLTNYSTYILNYYLRKVYLFLGLGLKTPFYGSIVPQFNFMENINDEMINILQYYLFLCEA